MDKPLFNKVSFIKSIKDFTDRPLEELPEIVFAGRSNVGKSSLLNAIWNRNNLAKTSSSPGKTRLINYYLVNEAFYFIDLPGYGYARMNKSEADEWKNMIERLLLNSQELQLICLLIDSRHDLMESDAQMVEWLMYNQLPFIIVLTKTDKISKNKLAYQLRYFQEINPDFPVLPFSIKFQKDHLRLSKFILKRLD